MPRNTRLPLFRRRPGYLAPASSPPRKATFQTANQRESWSEVCVLIRKWVPEEPFTQVGTNWRRGNEPRADQASLFCLCVGQQEVSEKKNLSHHSLRSPETKVYLPKSSPASSFGLSFRVRFFLHFPWPHLGRSFGMENDGEK